MSKRRSVSVGISAVAVSVGLGASPTLALSGEPTSTRSTLVRLSSQFTSSNWPSVSEAKETLESLQGQAIPVLIALLSRNEYVKLQDTADLIYPGASEFWGHGGIVDYDIDWLSVRAGWALEDLTFQNFGFREGAIDQDTLLKAVVAGNSDVPLSKVLPPAADTEARRRRRSRAIAAAAAWWAHSSGEWSRLAAVLEALRSGDTARQVTVLDWLRNGETRCGGLTKESFTRGILPEVRRLSESGDSDVKEQATYLVRDFKSNEWYWLQIKGRTSKKR